MNTVDTKLLLDRILSIENLAKTALDRSEIISRITLQDLEVIKESARNLIDHIKWTENLNYIEGKISNNKYSEARCKIYRRAAGGVKVIDHFTDYYYLYCKEQQRLMEVKGK